jgi:phosphomannomutase/phosphoglucomutase
VEFPGATEVIRIDGLRVEYADGFGLARASNTTPVVVLRFEAESEAALARIQAEFRRVLGANAPGLALPF